MSIRLSIGVLGFALAASACAPEGALVGSAPDGSPIYSRSFTPTSGDGAVTLSCVVGEFAGLENCRVVREQPEGRGYGAMALAMVDKPDVRLDHAGFQTGSRVEFTLHIRED